MEIRALVSELLARASLAAAGETHGGKRNVNRVCGYKPVLTLGDYRERYNRNEIAGRVIESFPNATWRGGGELVENDDVDVITPFEATWNELNDRLHLWPTFLRADILAGLGQYSVLLIGGPGRLDTPLPTMSSPDTLAFVQPYPQTDVGIETWETDETNERFGLPLSYRLRRLSTTTNAKAPRVDRSVHWSRIIHLADGVLDDQMFGTPRLERIWNRLDDLEKVVAGGAEAFWKRADQGMQVDIDPEVKLTPEAERKFQDEVDEYIHELRRVIRTRGVKMNPLGSDVANFGPPAQAIIDLIAGGTQIPQRVLLGSERGELASTQDRENWNGRVSDRRTQWAEPMVIRPFVSRLTDVGLFPQIESYDVWWPTIRDLTEEERASIALKLAQANQANSAAGGTNIVTEDEIRDLILELPPMDGADVFEAIPATIPKAARHLWRKRLLSIVRQKDMRLRLSA